MTTQGFTVATHIPKTDIENREGLVGRTPDFSITATLEDPTSDVRRTDYPNLVPGTGGAGVIEADLYYETSKPEPQTLSELAGVRLESEVPPDNKLHQLLIAEWPKFADHMDSLGVERQYHANRRALYAAWMLYAASRLSGQSKINDTATGVAAVETMHYTGNIYSGPIVAIAVGSILARLNCAAMNKTIDVCPIAYESAASNLGSVTRTVSDSLPYVNYHTDAEIERRKHLPRGERMRLFMSAHWERGLVAMTKVTTFARAAGREGQTSDERTRLSNAVSLENGLMIGAVLLGSNVAVSVASAAHEEVGDAAARVVHSPFYLSGIGFIIMAKNLVPKTIRRIRG